MKWLLFVLAVSAALFLWKLQIVVAVTSPCEGKSRECAEARATLSVLPKTCSAYIHSLSIHYDQGPGLLSGFADTYGNVWVSGNLSRDEFRAVLIQECGHVTDFFALTGNPNSQSTRFTMRTMPTFMGDPSLEFYTLSWSDRTTKKPGVHDADFVSKYAQLNAYEDFAETYTYYVVQRTAFKKRATLNAVLQKKYEFMRKLFPSDFNPARGASWDGKIPGAVTNLSYVWLAGDRETK